VAYLILNDICDVEISAMYMDDVKCYATYITFSLVSYQTDSGFWLSENMLHWYHVLYKKSLVVTNGYYSPCGSLLCKDLLQDLRRKFLTEVCESILTVVKTFHFSQSVTGERTLVQSIKVTFNNTPYSTVLLYTSLFKKLWCHISWCSLKCLCLVIWWWRGRKGS
jgi:hypothetical protein